MNYKSVVKSALSSLGVPIFFQTYTGTAATYITFFCFNTQDTEFAENNAIATTYYIQIDIWSKTSDYDSLADRISTAMLAAGFKTDGAQDLYETDTKIFHKAMRFNILDEGDI